MTLVLAIIIPFISAFFIPLLHLAKKTIPVAAIGGLGLVSIAASLAAAFSGWQSVSVSLLGGWAPDIGIVLVADRLTSAFLVLASVGSGAALLCSLEKFRGGPWRYYSIFFLMLGAMNGILLTGDLFNLFVFYEIFSVSAYLIVAFSMSWQALEAGLKYLVLGTIGALFILLGTAFTYMSTGQLNMALISEALTGIPGETLTAISACLILGLSIKTGAFPVHFWLPDAHSSAQTAVSALLSGVVIKVSIYALMRISYLFFLRTNVSVFAAITIIGSLSVLGGHLMALRQDDIKRMLAYSTVAQIGYILIGVGCATAAGAVAAVFHAFNHMLMKMGLFITAGSISDEKKTREIPRMNGLWLSRPRLVVLFTVLAAAIVGIPPLNGFMSKWYLILASAGTGGVIPALIIVAGTVISAAYYIRVIFRFFAPGDAPGKGHPQRPFSLAVAVIFAISCAAFGLLPFTGAFRECLFSIGESATDVAGYLRAVTGG
ncbi:MAG: proton-conducting transporter membrane subunit [Thermovirgaceae bacterium]|nr:proton-conducting transporter membrane subunit [Thermovirgaceae bacterium]